MSDNTWDDFTQIEVTQIDQSDDYLHSFDMVL